MPETAVIVRYAELPARRRKHSDEFMCDNVVWQAVLVVTEPEHHLRLYIDPLAPEPIYQVPAAIACTFRKHCLEHSR